VPRNVTFKARAYRETSGSAALYQVSCLPGLNAGTEQSSEADYAIETYGRAW
jgi:hypothetical protein